MWMKNSSILSFPPASCFQWRTLALARGIPNMTDAKIINDEMSDGDDDGRRIGGCGNKEW